MFIRTANMLYVWIQFPPTRGLATASHQARVIRGRKTSRHP